MTAHTTEPPKTELYGPYSVQMPSSGTTFRLTLPADLRSQFGFETGDELAVHAGIAADGTFVLQYIPAPYAPEGLPTVSVSRPQSSAITRIPSAIGRAFGLDDTDKVQWRLRYDVDNLDIKTDAVPTKFRLGPQSNADDDTHVPILEVRPTSRTATDEVLTAATSIAREPMSRQTQDDIQRDGQTWSQEQFRYYLSGERMAELGWASGEDISITVRHHETKAALVFTPLRIDERDGTCLTTTVNGTGSRQVDGLIYIPPSLVRGFDFVDAPLLWSRDKGRLIATQQTE